MSDTLSPHPVIALDGPSASGKSSVAAAVARLCGYLYVNTGAMYRGVTWEVLARGLQPETEAEQALATLHFGTADGRNTVGVQRPDGVRLLTKEELDAPAVAAAVSAVAANSAVRRALVARQREYALEGPLVMEGRDIGSVVFPQTRFKYYIDASPEVRAARRQLEGLADDLARRDRKDSSRADSPLVLPEGALRIDTSDLDLPAVISTVLEDLKAKGIA